MSHCRIFFNFIRANCKRLIHYLPSMFVSFALLLILTGTAGFFLSSHLYKENIFSIIPIGYYLPPDDNLDFNQLGIGMLQDLEGMQDTVSLQQVSSIEEGYDRLASHEILYLIIVPEQFFSGIMDSTNPPLDIVVYDNTSLSSYIINSTIPETKQPESKPIEIIENSNSTGIISSIHKRLNQSQKEIIEITDSLNEGEVLENTDSMPLVSNELYNAVILPLLSSYSSHYLQFNLVKD